jgi:hypothetical protein
MRKTLAVVLIVAARCLQWATNNKRPVGQAHNTPGLATGLRIRSLGAARMCQRAASAGGALLTRRSPNRVGISQPETNINKMGLP